MATGPRLVVIEPDEQAGVILGLSEPEMVIGNSDTADLVLDDQYVSRRHALVTVDASGQVAILDLNSTGGTFVNDERVTASRLLEPGDLVRFADVVARFEPGTSAAQVPTSQVPAAAMPTTTMAADAYTVTGTVRSPVLPGVGGLTVHLVDKNVGGDEELASTRTRGDGSYALGGLAVQQDYLAAHHKTRLDLQVQVFGAGSLLAESEVRYSAPPTLTLDVTLPAEAAGLPSEYESLVAAIAAAYPGRLGELREDSQRQDITYLAGKTGWDARAVAMASLADQFSQITAPAPEARADPGQTLVWPVPVVSLQPEFYYALFRAGQPARADTLFGASPATVQATWEQAIARNVIPRALAGEVPPALTGFKALSTAHLLASAADLLRDTLGLDTHRHRRYASLAVEHADDPQALWQAVDDAFGADTGMRLRLDSQLAALTMNNTSLILALHAAESEPPLTSTSDLAARGYHQSARWAALLDGAPVPAGLPGETAGEQRSSYAAALAAQVRLSHPTAVIADLVRTGAAPVRGGPAMQRAVSDFLDSGESEFDIGAEPVEQYLARSGLAGELAKPVVDEIKRLQRVYQITPSDEALAALLRHGVDSAYKITRYDQAAFVRAFGTEMGGDQAAVLTHSRATMVYAAALNVAMTYLSGQRAPRLGSGQVGLIDHGQVAQVSRTPAELAAAAQPVAIAAGPTLEQLFGSLDFCACDDCRSILSPAAYLVDLLDYLDNPPGTAGNPLSVLLGRRPDLQHLPLTCDNTNIALPYIDIVNETLEYFVCNNLTLVALSPGTVGNPYSPAVLTAAGGTPPYSWLLAQGSSLPPGLTLGRDGTISGTPTVGGTTAFAVVVSDSSAAVTLDSAAELSITIFSDLVITASAALPDGQVGGAYTPVSLTAAGGTPPYTWSGTTAALPYIGLTLSPDGIVSGTPGIGGTAEFTVTITDSTSPTPLTSSQQMWISVISPLTTSPSALPLGQVNVDYQPVTLVAAGGTAPYTWQVAPWSMMLDGMMLATDGTISGQPGTGGISQTTFLVMDAAGLMCLQTVSFTVTSGLAVATSDYAGHTTDGSVSSAELLASPQFVNDQAYAILQQTQFPPPLPFDRPLEQLRLYFGLFGMSLQEAAVALLPVSSTAAWTAILTEELRLSPQEHLLLTDSAAPLQYIYGYPNLTDQAVITALSGVQNFCRRIGVSYDDLFAILATRFVNPAATILPRLEALNMPFMTFMTLYNNQAAEETAFNNAVPASVSPADYGGNVASWVISNYPQIIRLITVVDPTGGTDLCTAANLQLQYADPDSSLVNGVPANTLHAIDFVRLLRFIRLWQKLGLSVEVTDDIITALYPASDGATGNDANDLTHLDAGIQSVLVRLGFAYRLLANLGLDPASALQHVLACWAPIGTTGPNSLYQQLFLASSTLQPDPAFAPNQYGDVLTDATQTLLGHEPALRAALSLTGSEIALIATAQVFDASTPLTLPNVSAVYRRGWLARALRISVLELLDLINYTGLYPFAPPDLIQPSRGRPTPVPVWPTRGGGPVFLPPLSQPVLEPPVIRFVRLVQSIAAASLTPAQALYLIWNHDPSGTAGPTQQDALNLATTLRGDFAAVESQFAVADDPTGTIAQQLMALVYGTDASDFFFGLINGTMSTTVPYSDPAGALPLAVLGVAAGRLAYDDLRKQLSYSGVLDPATLRTLIDAAAGDTGLATALGALSAANHQAVDPFLATYPELLAAYLGYVASGDSAPVRRGELVTAILTDLKPVRKQEQALAAATAAAGTDPSFAAAILNDPTVLHAATDTSLPAVSDLTAIEAQGLAAQFYLGNDPTAMPDLTLDSVAELSYAPCVAGPAQSVLIEGAITPGETVTVTINGVAVIYTVTAADTTPAILAAHIADAIRAATALDPISGLPLNSVVSASGPPGAITISPDNPALTLTLACTQSAAGPGAFTAAGQSPVLQATVTGTFAVGTVLTTTINGVAVSYTVQASDTSPAIIASNIATAINQATGQEPVTHVPLNQAVSASGPPGAVTVKAATTAATLTVACSQVLTAPRSYTTGPAINASQTATVSGSVTAGDVLTTTINGVAVPYHLSSRDTTLPTLASNIATAINATTTTVPGSGRPLNAIVSASAAGDVVTITATSFGPAVTVACSASANATEGYAAGTAAEASRTGLLAGATSAGDVLTTTINAVAIPYTVSPADTTLADMASHVAAAVNATTTTDPVSGQPINSLVTASAAGDVVAIAAAGPGEAFTLGCGLTAGAYTATSQVPVSMTATITGAMTAGDVLTTTVNGVAIPYSVKAADTVTSVATGIAAAVNASTAADPATRQPLNTVVKASSTGGIMTVTAIGPSVTVTLACSASAGATESYSPGPACQAWLATVTGGFAVGDVLSTEVNGVEIPYSIATSDVSPAIIAGHVAMALNSTTATDPATGLPLNSLITATSAAGDVVIKAASPSFALACSLSAGATETATVSGELPARPGGGLIAGTWYGYIGVPQDGYYNVRVLTDPGASPHLEIGGAAITMEQPPAGGSLWSNQSPIWLSASSLTAISLTVTSLATTMAVVWESTGLGWQPIPGTYLYSGTLVARLAAAYSRFVKAASLASALSLTAAEIAFLAADPDLAVFGRSWLNVLPTAGPPVPSSQTATVGGAISAGDVLTTTINGVAVAYTVAASDTTLPILAGSIAAAINSATTPDPLTGLPLDSLVTASSAGAVITVTAVAPGAALAVACSTSQTATETYTAGTLVPSTAAALTGVLSILLDYARVKAAISPSDERVLAVVKSPTTDALIALTGWDPISVNALLTRLFGTTVIAHIGHVENLSRLFDAYAVVTASGISADRLIPAITTNPTPAVAADLQAAVRSRYAEGDWLAVVKPINDTMRDLQRDALVAYVLQQLGDQGPQSPTADVNTPDKLFEYLLMDPQMEPCMETSRIRHALSSVQLFTEMCLRNLVPQVNPQDIPPGWEWRKRYRVWQANREVFLWPENWLAPELRDGQSAFFKQTLSELLQGDMTDDAATSAYLSYLTDLESVAKLEPSGIWYDGFNCDVIARTAGAHRKYYHRKLIGASWTPWDEVKLGIEDNPVVPYVWNGRLMLFWLRVLQQAPTDGTTLIAGPGGTTGPKTVAELTYDEIFPTKSQVANSTSTFVTVDAILCYSEYINGEWQPVKTSDPLKPTSLGKFAAGAWDRSLLELAIVPASVWWPNADGSAIWVQIFADQTFNDVEGQMPPTPPQSVTTGGGFLLYNTHSTPVRGEDTNLPAPAVAGPGAQRFWYYSLLDDSMLILYNFSGATSDSGWTLFTSPVSERVTQSQISDFYALGTSGGEWLSPFFLEDSRHVFFVVTDPPAGSAMKTIGASRAPSVRIPPLVTRQPRIQNGQRQQARYLIGSSKPVTYGESVIADGSSPITIRLSVAKGE